MEQPGHYDLIISYAHEDKAFAQTLYQTLLAYRPLFKLNGRSRLNVYLDSREADSPNLNEALQLAIRNSDKLIVLCSAAARASTWVNWELSHFIEAHGGENIIPVLLEGEPDLSFPQALAALPGEPWAVDFRERPARLRDNKDSWFHLLASIYGVSREVIENREFNKKLYLAGLSLVVLVIIATLGIVFYSQKRRTESIDLARQASVPYREVLDFEQRVNLAVKALQTYDTPQARSVLQSLLSAYFNQDNPGSSINLYFVIGKSDWLFYSNVLGGNYLYNLRTGETRLLFRDLIATTKCLLTPDSRYLVTIDIGGRFKIWDLSSRLLKASVLFDDRAGINPDIDLSGDGMYVHAHLNRGDTSIEKKWSVPAGALLTTDTLIDRDDQAGDAKDPMHHEVLFTDWKGASLTDSDYKQKRAVRCDIHPYHYCKILQYNAEMQLALLKLSDSSMNLSGQLNTPRRIAPNADSLKIYEYGLMNIGRGGSHRVKLIAPSFDNFHNLNQWFPNNDTISKILTDSLNRRYKQFNNEIMLNNSIALPGTNFLLIVTEPFLEQNRTQHAGLFDASDYRLIDTLPWHYGTVKSITLNKDKTKAAILAKPYGSDTSYLMFLDLRARRLIKTDTTSYSNLNEVPRSDLVLAAKFPNTDRDTSKTCFWEMIDFDGHILRQTNRDHYFNDLDYLGKDRNMVVAGNYTEFYLWRDGSKEPVVTIPYEQAERKLFALDKKLLEKQPSRENLLKIAADWVNFSKGW